MTLCSVTHARLHTYISTSAVSVAVWRLYTHAILQYTNNTPHYGILAITINPANGFHAEKDNR